MTQGSNVVMSAAQFNAERRRYMEKEFPKRQVRMVEYKTMCCCNWGPETRPYPHRHSEMELRRFYSQCKYH